MSSVQLLISLDTLGRKVAYHFNKSVHKTGPQQEPIAKAMRKMLQCDGH